MQLKEKEITLLEGMFSVDCQAHLDTLTCPEATEEDFAALENCLNHYFQYDNIKEFITKSLIEKTKEVVCLFKPQKNKEKGNWNGFKKLSQFIVNYCDEKSIGAFTTFLLTNKLPTHFFIFLQELVQRGSDTREHQKVFESLIFIHQYSLEIINKYLSIVNQEPFDLVKHLLAREHFASVIYYIRKINSEKDYDLIGLQIVPSILENFVGQDASYFGMIMSVAEGSPNHLQNLLRNCKQFGNVEARYAHYMAVNQAHNISAIKNLMSYLAIHNPEIISTFEDRLLKDTRPHLLVNYATEVSNSNKRKVLVRLVEIKDEEFIVKFIKNFPTFRSLMPML